MRDVFFYNRVWASSRPDQHAQVIQNKVRDLHEHFRKDRIGRRNS